MSDGKTDAGLAAGQWCGVLTPEQQRVLRAHGTEPPRSSPLDKEYREGRYYCVGCGAALLVSDPFLTAECTRLTPWPKLSKKM